MDRKLWAGVDIGGTKTAVVISADPPHVLKRVEFPTLPANGPGPAIERIKSALWTMLAQSGGDPSFAGIGVSCGNPQDSTRGIIQAPPNLPTWIDVPIVDILQSKFGCPAHLENDANAGALAEHRFGAGRGARNIVFLTMGTGFGAGVILDGRVYQGTNGYAGEIGHVRLTPDGPVGYHKAGSAEGWVSGGGLAQWAAGEINRARATGEQSLLLDAPADQSVTARDVGLAAEKDDALACRIVAQLGEKLGHALAILVDILNPERLVIGGLAMRLGERLLEPARRTLAQEALQQSVAVCQVVPAALGESIGDVAALCIALDAGAHSLGEAEERKPGAPDASFGTSESTHAESRRYRCPTKTMS
jgi:glucokinase